MNLAILSRLGIGGSFSLDVCETVVVLDWNRLVRDSLAGVVLVVETFELVANLNVVHGSHGGRNGDVRTLLGVSLGEYEIDFLDCWETRMSI